MSKREQTKSSSESAGSGYWIARDNKSGRFVKVTTANRRPSTTAVEAVAGKAVRERRPGRFKGVLKVGPEFFEPLSEDDLAELTGA